MNIDLNTLVSSWGWALVHFLWQGLLIGVVTALLLRLFRQAKPQVRYAIACSALLLCFILPISSVWRSLAVDVSSGVVSVPTQALLDITSEDRSDFSGVVLQNTLHGKMPWLVIAWSLGCVFFSLRMALGLMWITNTRRRSLANTDASLQSKLNLLAIQFGLKRPINLLICNEIDSPVTAGWWKPIVLMPTALAIRLPPDLIEALLAHELAHIKRHDYLINLMQSAIEALLFFHPVIWWLSKQIRIERENIADDLAATVLGEPRRLALALEALDQFQFNSPSLAPAANGGDLMSRIQRLVKPNHAMLNWKFVLPILSLALVCLSVYAREQSSASGHASISTIATTATIATTSITPITPTTKTTSHTNSSKTYSNSDGKSKHETYALVIAGKQGMMVSGNTNDIAAIEKTKNTLDSDFLWFNRKNKTYVVQDSAVIAKVKAAWQDSNKVSAEMDAIGAKMDAHGKVMNGIGAKMDAVSGGSDAQNNAMEKISQDMQAIGLRQEALGKEMEVLGNKRATAQSDAQREALDKNMEVQSAKMAALSEEMEKHSKLMEEQSNQLERSLKPLDSLSAEMDEAAKPLNALGKQMDVLGKRLDALTKKADEEVMSIIDDSIKNGQAVPLDRVATK
jgi:beta-lactamase regulating signal transducer with metallopeptidase domain/predicted  nucleic acid-binding Zn-ribbon protein